LTDNI